jgi:hypothetical protein
VPTYSGAQLAQALYFAFEETCCPPRGHERSDDFVDDAMQPNDLERPALLRGYSDRFFPGFDVLLGCNDSLAFLKTVPSSTPCNLGKPYEKRAELKDYLKAQLAVLKERVRVLKEDGSLCWQARMTKRLQSFNIIE